MKLPVSSWFPLHFQESLCDFEDTGSDNFASNSTLLVGFAYVEPESKRWGGFLWKEQKYFNVELLRN
jgi:hypothetical protein